MVLVARYAAQQALAMASDMAAELLGGIAFMRSSEIGYLLAAVRPLAYHPPSRTATAEPLVDYFSAGRWCWREPAHRRLPFIGATC